MKISHKLKLAVVFGALVSCVDDYTEANEPPLLDGPQAYVTVPASGNIVSKRSDGFDVVYILKDENLNLSVMIPDAPGKIESAHAALSDTLGTVAVSDNFSGVVGKEQGSFNVVYTPRADDPLSNFDDGVVSISTSVTDFQEKSNQPDVKRVRAIECLPSRNLAGWWRVTSSGKSSVPFVGDNEDGTYTNLKAFVRLQIRTNAPTIAGKGSAEHAGALFLNDASFGLYPKTGRTAPTGRLEFCGSDLTAETVAGITITGQINADGTITLNWTNDAATNSGEATLVYDGY